MTVRGRSFRAGHFELRRRRKAAAVAIGRRVARRRKALGLLQSDVAGDVFTDAYISAIERGLATPSLASLLHLSTALRVRPTYFLWGIE